MLSYNITSKKNLGVNMSEIKRDIIIGDTNYSNPIKGKEQQIIDAFVKVYGEQHREKIAEKIL